jgi:hypothetical protein
MHSNVAHKDDETLTGALGRWWRNWRRRRVALAEVAALDSHARERIAQDSGLSADDLPKLVSSGPDAADLLDRRLEALHLDRDELKRNEPAVLRDLQRLCSFCESKGRCMRDLARDPDNPGWVGYCPNAPTLTALQTEAADKATAPIVKLAHPHRNRD